MLKHASLVPSQLWALYLNHLMQVHQVHKVHQVQLVHQVQKVHKVHQVCPPSLTHLE